MKKTISLSDKVLAYVVSEANYNLRKTTLLGLALSYAAIYAKLNSKAFLAISRKLSKAGKVQYELSSFHDVQQSLNNLGIKLSDRKIENTEIINSIVSSLTKKEKSLFNSFSYLYFSKASTLAEFLDNNIHIISSKDAKSCNFSIKQLAAKEKEVFFEGTLTIQDNANFVLTTAGAKASTKTSSDTSSNSKPKKESKKKSNETETLKISKDKEKSNLIIDHYSEVWDTILNQNIEKLSSLYFTDPEDACKKFAEETDFKSIINVFFATKMVETNVLLTTNFKNALKILNDSYQSTVLKCNNAFPENAVLFYNKLMVEHAECLTSIHPETLICLPFFLGTKGESMVTQYIEFQKDDIILSEVITSVEGSSRGHAIDCVRVSVPSFAELSIAKTITDMNEVCEKFTAYSTIILFLGELISFNNK